MEPPTTLQLYQQVQAFRLKGRPLAEAMPALAKKLAPAKP